MPQSSQNAPSSWQTFILDVGRQNVLFFINAQVRLYCDAFIKILYGAFIP